MFAVTSASRGACSGSGIGERAANGSKPMTITRSAPSARAGAIGEFRRTPPSM
jgi:hypothetical protein